MELKPCPFCGGVAEVQDITRHIENNSIVVRCSRCGVSTKPFNDNRLPLALEAWNRRADNADKN